MRMNALIWGSSAFSFRQTNMRYYTNISRLVVVETTRFNAIQIWTKVARPRQCIHCIRVGEMVSEFKMNIGLKNKIRLVL